MSKDRDRIVRLAKRAQQLDDVIKKAADMQKAIVEEIRQIGKADRLSTRRPTRTPRRRKKR